ncbi:hypothetical protein ABZ626_20205 [Streptomyces longispororuber]|uniref:hypothetical protein n=1 Tax=Streptomyces longispororuber TaxID=68230 RepID=UPI0033E84125
MPTEYGVTAGQADIPDAEGMAAAEGLGRPPGPGRRGDRGPFPVIDGRYALAGAPEHSTPTPLLGILRQVGIEPRPAVPTADDDAAACAPDGCAVLSPTVPPT